MDDIPAKDVIAGFDFENAGRLKEFCAYACSYP